LDRRGTILNKPDICAADVCNLQHPWSGRVGGVSGIIADFHRGIRRFRVQRLTCLIHTHCFKRGGYNGAYGVFIDGPIAAGEG
jgi:hypothetical protein